MSSDFSSTLEPGVVIVEVPHWAATVRVFDNLCDTAVEVSSPVETGTGLFQVMATVKPGVYKVDVALGTSSDSEWVSVRPGRQTTVPAARWQTLQLASAAPLQKLGSSGPGPFAEAASEWSHKVTWTAPQPGQARLFIFIHTPDAVEYPSFSNGLTLLDATGRALTPIEGGATFKDAMAGWMAFATDLPGGFYILSRNGPGPVVYNQPLYLCENWETHAFIVGARGPSFRSLTINMAPHGAGFRHDDETASAATAVLTALLREQGMRAVLGSTQLSRMLRQENRNPWLAVLAVHAIMTIEEEARRGDGVPASIANYDPALKDEVLAFLNATIGHHPDVRALNLKPDAPAAEPFTFPPMLRMSLRRVQQHATKFADTIPLASLTDRMVDRQVTSSAWSLWRMPADVERVAEAARTAPPGLKPGALRRIATAVLRNAFGPNAPIYLAPRAAGTMPPGIDELGRVLYDLPVIEAARNMIGSRAGSLPEKIVVDAKAELSKLLETVDARELSAVAGIPLGRVERAIERLQRKAAAGLSLAEGAGPTSRAVLEFALRQTRVNRRPGGTVPGENAEKDGKNLMAPHPESVGRITLEECVSKLRSAALQMTPGAESAAPENSTDAPRAAGVALRLNAIADALLGHANLIAITGADGQFLYGNGAFSMLMTLTGEKDTLKSGRRWCRWLSTLPQGRSTNVTSPFDRAGRRWTVHRAAVEYAAGEPISGYVNILDDERMSRLPGDVYDRVAGTVSDVTLHASFVQYGSPRRRTASLDRLEEIVTGLERELRLETHESDGAGRAQMAMTRFDAPGFLQDWNDAAAKKWSEWISTRLDEVRASDGSREGLSGYGPRLQFFNPLTTPPAADAVDKDIAWTAFPRIVQLQSISDRQRWRTADSSRDAQDEYCEWSITRDPATEKIQRVMFTSEGPEYWEFLAAVAPSVVVELYKQHVSPDVKRADLFRNGRYQPRNRWNNSTTAGAMHLIQPNNTLGAEIELAGAATIVRRRNGVVLTETQELIECGQYGQPERHSDPLIGATVNELARLKADVTLKNPIGLYIAGLSVAGWQTPDGSDPLGYWTITRGTKEKALRAVYEVPAAKGFLVGDIKINGKPIEFGGQIADFIRIKLTGTATRIGQSTVAPFDTCVTSGAGDPGDAGALNVEDVLAARGFRSSR